MPGATGEFHYVAIQPQSQYSGPQRAILLRPRRKAYANNDEGADDLTTRLAGSFTGWDGDTVFRLENGQLWQQIDSSYLYSRSESPRVTMRRAAFGSYLLQVEGIGWTVRVRRLE